MSTQNADQRTANGKQECLPHDRHHGANSPVCQPRGGAATRFKILWLTILSLGLVVVCLPRFNRHEVGPVHQLNAGVPSAAENLSDAAEYIRLTEYFRGVAAGESLLAPFSYRPLAPFVASLLPLEPMTALNVVNIVSLLVGLYFLWQILEWLGLPLTHCAAGCALYVFSFPVFYYGAIGIVDPVLIGLLVVAVYALLTGRWPLLVLALTLGVLAKETIVLVLPVLFVALILVRGVGLPRALLYTVVLSLYVVAVHGAVRVVTPGVRDAGWPVSLERLVANLERPRAVLSLLLTLGVPGALALICLARRFPSMRGSYGLTLVFVAGFLMSAALAVYALFSAYADGRFLWPSYCFTIPLAMYLFRPRVAGVTATP